MLINIPINILVWYTVSAVQIKGLDCLCSFFRNNLTVFDMVMVQGHGAKELLRVGGKLPGQGASLRFNVPQSTLMECRDGEVVLYI